jgi:ABC-type sugar transport system permease subunit
VAPIALAYALHIILKYKVLYRTVYFLPAVMSAATVFFLWRELFGLNGPLNKILRAIGFEARRPWTEDPYLAMISCVRPGIWAGDGPVVLSIWRHSKPFPMSFLKRRKSTERDFLGRRSRRCFHR